MTEQVMDKKEKKYGKPVIISGIILGVVTIITGICLICKASGMAIAPNVLVFGAAWCLLAFPLAIIIFLLCLMWNTIKSAKQAQIKLYVTIFVLFLYMMYSMFALLLVWIVKTDNTPVEDTTTSRYQITQEVEELV